MANRVFDPRRYSMEKKVVDLYAQYTIGATPTFTATAVAGHTKGITSITHSGTGIYTMVLDDAYMALLDFKVTLLRSAVDAVGLSFQLISEAVATVGTRTVVFQVLMPIDSSTTTKQAADLVELDKIFIHLALSNTDRYQ